MKRYGPHLVATAVLARLTTIVLLIALDPQPAPDPAPGQA